MKKKFTSLFALFLCLTSPLAHAKSATEVIKKWVVFETTLGNLALELYPDHAPQTVERFVRLVELGAYDTTSIFRIEPNFYLQVSPIYDRTKWNNTEILEAVSEVPNELNDIKHERGILSIAIGDQTKSNTETSFSVILDTYPHLNHVNIGFGKIIKGNKVLDDLEKVPVNLSQAPEFRIEILKATAFSSENEMNKYSYEPEAFQIGEFRKATNNQTKIRRRIALKTLLYGSIFLVFVMLTFFFVKRKMRIFSFVVLFLVTGIFATTLFFTPEGEKNPWIGNLLFFSWIATFKLMSQFETYRKTS